MNINNPFDTKLEVLDKHHDLQRSVLNNTTWSELKDASIFTVDTLDLCHAAAKALFEDEATPEHAFAIYDRIVCRLGKSMAEIDE